jgi:hypothetical protein
VACLYRNHPEPLRRGGPQRGVIKLHKRLQLRLAEDIIPAREKEKNAFLRQLEKLF